MQSNLFQFALLAMALGVCQAVAEPLSPEFAGRWKPATATNGCEYGAYRIEKQAIFIESAGPAQNLVKIASAESGSSGTQISISLTSEILNLLNLDQPMGVFAQRRRASLIYVATIRRAADKIIVSSVMARDTPLQELHPAHPEDEALLIKLLALQKCPDGDDVIQYRTPPPSGLSLQPPSGTTPRSPPTSVPTILR